MPIDTHHLAPAHLRLDERQRKMVAALRKKHPELTDSDQFGVVSKRADAVRVERTKGNGDQVDIVFTANTGDVDLACERVLPEGGDMSDFEKNGNLFVDHNYELDYWVASLRWIKRQGSAWVCKATLRSAKKSAYSETVEELALTGNLGASVGFRVVEAGAPTAEELKKYPDTEYIIRKWKCMEVSFTACPCNLSCRAHSVIYGEPEKSMAEAERIVTKRLPQHLWGDMGLSLPRKAVEIPPRRVVVCVGG